MYGVGRNCNRSGYNKSFPVDLVADFARKVKEGRAWVAARPRGIPFRRVILHTILGMMSTVATGGGVMLMVA